MSKFEAGDVVVVKAHLSRVNAHPGNVATITRVRDCVYYELEETKSVGNYWVETELEPFVSSVQVGDIVELRPRYTGIFLCSGQQTVIKVDGYRVWFSVDGNEFWLRDGVGKFKTARKKEKEVADVDAKLRKERDDNLRRAFGY